MSCWRPLAEGGLLHLATDWEAYALHMMEVLENEPTLINCSGAGKYCDLPARPETKFEQRGRRLGHGVWDLCLKRQALDLEPEAMLMLLEPADVLFVLRAN